MTEIKGIKVIDPKTADLSSFELHVADCVILTHDQKLFLQYRPPNWRSSPDCLNIFGGHVEDNESVIEALKREIKEETGGIIEDGAFSFIGCVAEEWTNYKELVHIYFWHDKKATITGCYEAESRKFENVEDVLRHDKVMDYTIWALKQCQNLGFLKKNI